MARPKDHRERERAARDVSKNLVVTAGAGSGKTSLLIERILHLVLEHEVPIQRIAAITFTVKAASELRDRVEEALERILELCEGVDPAAKAGEAERVFERLGEKERSRAAELALRALDALEEAPIGTIHHFAGEILRRHHRLAGVDCGFEVDEGEAFDALFEELWPQFLEENLGPGRDPGAWRGPLEKISLETLEFLARQLAAPRIPLEALGQESAELQRLAAKAYAARCLEKIREIRSETTGIKGTSRNLSKHLDFLESVFSRYEASGIPPTLEEIQELPKKPSLGTNYAGPRKEELEAAFSGLAAAARKFAEFDLDLIRDLCACLKPFAESFRRAYFERGYASYDALIVLTRDLLRDHPRVRRLEARRFDRILVDEFQDTDPIQYEILFFLAEDPGGGVGASRDAFSLKLEPGKLFIVGDEKQSIYHFRGADIRAYARAVRSIDRGGGEVLTLSANFRTVPEIVNPLNDLFRTQFPAPISHPSIANPQAPGGGNAAGAATAHRTAPECGFHPRFQPLVPFRESVRKPRIEIWSVGAEKLKAADRRALEAGVVASEIARWIAEGPLRAKDIAMLFASFSELDTYLRALRSHGVPYIVDGGKGFLRRYEVELLLAFLRAIAMPGDAVSLVACLRSPALAVPDEELRRYAAEASEQKKDDAAVWNLLAAPDPKEFPWLARALELLRSAARSGASLDALARSMCEGIPLRLAMAASYEGAQRVANLEKVLRRIARLVQEGRLTDAEIIRSIEGRETLAIDEGDSALTDETVDAVRVLTIHKAKGLEWPVVIIPDVARLQRPPRSEDEVELVEVAAGDGSAPGVRRHALAIRTADVRTPAHLLYDEDETFHREAEQLRLLYVATTRAKERLILLVGTPQRGGSSWVDALAAWGYRRLGGEPPGEESFAGGSVSHRTFAEAPPAPRRPGSEKPCEALAAAARAFEEARSRASELKTAGFLRPSELAESDDRSPPPAEGAASEEIPGAPAARSLAQAAGTAIHLLLELWDGGDPAWLFENAPRAAAIAASQAEMEEDPVLAEVRRILERAASAGRLEKLAALRPIARELPLLLRGEDGEIWDGAIDAVAGSREAPRIVDYKTTGEPRDLDALRRAYAGQLGLYARTVGEALGLPSPPPADVEPI